MKKLILSTAAIAFLAISATANTKVYEVNNKTDSKALSDYEIAKNFFSIRNQSIELIKDESIKHIENQKNVAGNLGRFYDKAGLSFTYTKAFHANFDELPNVSTLATEIGYNGDLFANIELKNKMFPKFWTDFTEENIEKMNSKNLNYFGLSNVFINSKIKLSTVAVEEDFTRTNRETDLLVGFGIGYMDRIISFGEAEINFSKGVFGNIDYEIEGKLSVPSSVPKFTNFKELGKFENGVLSLSAKNTAIKNKNYNSIILSVEYKF